MKRAPFSFVTVLLLVVIASPSLGQNADDQSPTRPAENASESNYHFVYFLPSYRFIQRSGFPGRVGEYDSLDQSVGGDLAMTLIDFPRHTTLKYRANLISRDDYDMDTQLRWGKYFTLGIQSRSFIRHLDNAPMGTDLLPDDIIRTEPVPQATMFGIKRTKNVVNARMKVPNSPLTLFVKGGWQSRRGYNLSQYYDMGAIANPGSPATCEGSCHSTSQVRPINYTTRNVSGGMELKINHVSVIYEHEFRSFNNRLQPQRDYFGSTIGSDDEPLPPGVPDTLEGYYVHNLLPSHTTQADSLRVRAPLLKALTFNGSVSYARTQNTYTTNPQNSLNADATLNWNASERMHVSGDFHQQNLLNSFTPSYPLFGNLSMHRFWAGLTADYRLSRDFDLETHYRRTNVNRSNASLWPQIYSPDNTDKLLVVPTTFSNTAGATLKFHHGLQWSARAGYEWVGTHAPGYLTDPRNANRLLASATFTPKTWLSFTEDFTALLQRSFPVIERQNRMYLNTSYVTVKPIAEWSWSLGYSYLQDNLKSDLTYLADPTLPIYTEGLAPYKTLSQGFTVSSTYLLKKRLGFQIDAGHVAAHSSFRPDLNPNHFPGVISDNFAPVLAASQYSQVDVPQATVTSALDYRFKGGFSSGIRFEYGSYVDRIHPDQTGRLRMYDVFVGRVW